jgi:hypothetical protein
MIVIPYILTFLTGFLSLKFFTRNNGQYPFFFLTSLSAITGIAITIIITFFSLVIYNHLNLIFIFFVHLMIIATLIIKLKPFNNITYRKPSSSTLTAAVTITFISALSSIYANNYPMGGWDAWTLWNFKSRFLLLSGTRWKELFDPMLARFHPHYPIGLPLFNAWTWAFNPEAVVIPPLINAVIFNFLLAALLTGILQRHCSGKRVIVPALIVFLSPVCMTFMTIQYCDILISLFLMAALGSIIEAHRSGNSRYLILTGLFIGTLAFLKLEGTVLAALTFILAHFYVFKEPRQKSSAIQLWISTVASALPIMLFLLFLAPRSQCFINGVTSSTQPATMSRLTTIFTFIFREVSSPDWHFLWWGAALSTILYANRLFQRRLLIFPGIIAIYLCIVIFQYWINTYYPIMWWLETSFRRILVTLIPLFCLWISLGILTKKPPAQKPGAETVPSEHLRAFDLQDLIPEGSGRNLDIHLLILTFPHQPFPHRRQDRQPAGLIIRFLRRHHGIGNRLSVIKILERHNRADINLICRDIHVLNDTGVGKLAFKLRDLGLTMPLSLFGRIIFSVFRKVPLQSGFTDRFRDLPALGRL